jgi:acetyltransferase-like isoleucine patch superfamily enzyme
VSSRRHQREPTRARAPEPLKRLYRLLAGHESIAHPEQWEIGERLILGRHTYGKPLVRWYREESDSVTVRFGQFCSIADDVIVMIGGDRPIDRPSTFPFRIRFGLPGAYGDGFGHSKGNVDVGSDVYVGRGVRLLSGVTVGDGAVLGAYSVIAKNVRPYAIMAGNPAREIARRFDDQQIEALLRIRWWDWTDKEIVERVPDLSDGTIEEFISLYDPQRPSGRRTTGRSH